MTKITDARLSRDDTGRVTSDYEPTPTEIEVCRDAICREFGNNGTDGYYIRILKAVHAAASLRAQGGVRVKPLEWDELNDGKTFRALLPIIGSIRVEPYGVCGWWEVLWSMPGQCDKLVPDVFDTPEEAKAAAQADYERRILSSLEASPAPVSGEIAKPTVEQAIESLVSALDEMRSQQAKRDEFLATLIVNIEKNEPTAEFAVNLREYVRNGRAAIAAKGGQ